MFLAMGGIALGKAVMSSGLLEVMDIIIRDMVDGFSLYTVVMILSPIVLVRLISMTCPVPLIIAISYVLGCIHIHQPHHRQCTSGAHRCRSWLEP